MHERTSPSIAVIGAGIAGLTCATQLAAAGFQVTLYDKSPHPGGRLASRGVEWTWSAGGIGHTLLDHGAPWFAARDPAFRQLLRAAEQAGALARWRPRIHVDGLARPADELHVGTPSMAALGRYLLTHASQSGGTPLQRHLGQSVTAAHRSAAGWRLDLASATAQPGQTSHRTLSPVFQHLVVALPAPQAAALLAPHQAAWARSLNDTRMQAGWTLLGITDEPQWPWDAAVPLHGPLSLLVREDRKPGRNCPPACAAWVAQADPAWAAAFAGAPPAQVAAHLQAAVSTLCPHPGGLRWHHLSVHRWRHTQPAARDGRQGAATVPLWDATLGVGVCGDSRGVERDAAASCVEAAWLSGRALAQEILGHHGATLTTTGRAPHRVGADDRLEAVPG